MIIHLFYYRDPNFDTYRLYAFTTDKRMADDFIEQRNMRRFYHKKRKIYKEELDSLKAYHGKLQLTYGTFYTRDNVNFGKRVPIKVLCTFMEEESVIFKSEELWMEYLHSLFDVKAYKTEYIQALGQLLFMDFFGFYKIKYIEMADSWYQPYYSNFGNVEGLILDEFRKNFEYDDLNLFLKFFHNTFKDSKAQMDE